MNIMGELGSVITSPSTPDNSCEDKRRGEVMPTALSVLENGRDINKRTKENRTTFMAAVPIVA